MSDRELSKLRPRVTLRSFTLVMAALAALLFTAGIWTGDDRFGTTGAIPTVLGFISGIGYLWTRGPGSE